MLWTDEEIGKLLSLAKDRSTVNCLNHAKCRVRAFDKLSTALKRSGYTRTLRQIRNKLKKLRRSYCRAKNSIWVEANQRGSCRHYKELDEIFGNSLGAQTNEIECTEEPEEVPMVDSGNSSIEGNDNSTETSDIQITEVSNCEDTGKSVAGAFSEIIQQLQEQLRDLFEKERNSYQQILQRMLEKEEQPQTKQDSKRQAFEAPVVAEQ